MKNLKFKNNRPKVLKYVQDFSALFEKMTLIQPDFSCSPDVFYYKAEHELDGQTYIIKKRKIFIENGQEIHEHPAYREILGVKDSCLPVNIRYVNSWVELEDPNRKDQPCQYDNGLNVYLCIQMRYIKDFVKLARDLIISGDNRNLDEDTLDDMSEDTYDEAKVLTANGVSLRDAILQSFGKIGFTATASPQSLEEEVWRI